jgi:hypothetical protein
MARLYVLLFLVQIILAITALISCLSAEEEEIRALPRLAWAAVILLFPLLGSIAWFLAGRPVRPSGVTGEGPGGNRIGRLPGPGRPGRGARPDRPLAPDDDPDFLRSLDAEQARRDRQMFEQWEADLRRREEDLRRRTDEPPSARPESEG